MQEVEKERRAIRKTWPLVSSLPSVGSDGGGDEDGIGGLETKKEATARLEPVGRRRAVRPDPGDGMQTF